MQTQSLKTTLLLSTLFTIVVVGFVTLTADDDVTPLGIILNAAVIFVIVFTTMRLTNRVTAFMVNRFAPNAPRGRDRDRELPPAAEPTSTRPEHAQRRRSRRRQRGRRRSGGE